MAYSDFVDPDMPGYRPRRVFTAAFDRKRPWQKISGFSMLILRPEEVEAWDGGAVDAVEKALLIGAISEINLNRRRLHFSDARLSDAAALPAWDKIGLRIQSEILAVSGGRLIHRAVRWSTCCSTCAQRCRWLILRRRKA
jgi:hypothetical protein